MFSASLLQQCTTLCKPGARLRSGPGLTSPIVKSYASSTPVGFFMDDSSHPVTQDGYFQWIPVMDSNGTFIGYMRNDVCQIKTDRLSPDDQVKVMIQQMLDNDLVIANRIIFCNQILAERAKKGEDVSALQNQINAYTSRLNTRQQLIQQNPTVLAVKKTMADDLSYAEYLQLKWLGPLPLMGMGAVPVVAIVIGICALAVVLVATYAIVAKIYGPSYDQGKVDFASLPNLQKLIATADPTTAAKVKAEIQSVHDQAAKNQAKKDDEKNSSSPLSTLAYVAAAAFIAMPLMNANNNSKPRYALPAGRNQ